MAPANKTDEEKGLDETSVASAEDVDLEAEDFPLDGVKCKEGCLRYV